MPCLLETFNIKKRVVKTPFMAVYYEEKIKKKYAQDNIGYISFNVILALCEGLLNIQKLTQPK